MCRALMLCLAVAAAALAAPGSARPARAPGVWALVLENNSFHGRYPDLPVGYVNSTRMLTALARRGWPSDHILLRRDVLEREGLSSGIAWLGRHAQPGDVVVLYAAGEYQFFARDLAWARTVPALWQAVPASNRVLVVESCFAERLTAAVSGIPGLALPAVGPEEWDWWGLRPSGDLIRGAPFTYFLAAALLAQPAGPLDFRAAFSDAVAGSRAYFRRVIAASPEALESFHVRGSFPERLPAFPNPHLGVGLDAQAGPSSLAP
jgi:hypothetical protein